MRGSKFKISTICAKSHTNLKTALSSLSETSLSLLQKRLLKGLKGTDFKTNRNN